MGRDEAIHRIRDFCTSRNAPAVLQATPTGRPYAPQLRPHSSSGGPRHTRYLRPPPRKRRATSRYFRGHPAHPPASPGRVRAAQRICSSDPGSAQRPLFASLLVFLYLSPAAPQPGPICARPFAIVTSLSVLSPPRPPGILSRASMLRDS
jgi:hypothetical protein